MTKALAKSNVCALRQRLGGLCAIVLYVLLFSLLGSSVRLVAQTSSESESDRKLISRVDPDYPEALKRRYISGVVRVQISVNPNGSVESTELLGGNPILGQAAMKAIKNWKYAAAPEKERIIVKVVFEAH